MAQSVPKYLFLVNWIKDQIAHGEMKFGDKLYSEHELCSIFGISRQTVRQAVGILEQENVVERRRGSGTYIVLKRPKRIETKKIGVISTYIGEYIFTNILSGIESVLSANGYTMQLMFTHDQIEKERRALKTMLESNVDGIIVEPTKSGLPNPNIELYNEIRQKGIPLIFFNACYPGESFPSVSLDDTAAGELAVQYLIQSGHRQIGTIMQSDDIQGRLRYEGYMRALIKNGLELVSNRVVWFTSEDIADLSVYPERIIKRFADCTAILCYNDQIAAKLVKMLRQAGIEVPLHMSVISIDNSDLAEMCEVPLTSVLNPVTILGKTVAENMLALTQDPDFDGTRRFTPEIIERMSVAINGGGISGQ